MPPLERARVLFLFSNFNAKGFTGQPGTIWQAIKHIAHRYDAFVFSNDDHVREVTEDNVQLKLFKASRNQLLSYGAHSLECWRFVLKARPHVIHVHGLPIMLFAAVLSRLRGVPLTCSFNEDITLRPKWLQRSLAAVINSSVGVVVSCDYFAERLRELGVRPEQIHVAPFGLGQEFLAAPPAVAEEYDVLYFGDARRSRGYDYVCNLAKTLTQYQFRVLLRKLPDMSSYDHMQPPVLPNVETYYYPYREPLKDHILKARTVVLPFRTTSAILPPMTIVEAMALGRCVMTTPLPGGESLCEDGETAIMLPLDNEAAGSRLLDGLLRRSDERRRLGLNARQRVVDVFGRQYEAMEALLNRAVARVA